MATKSCDALVIGGGLGGLAAAAYLARAGRRTTVLERSKLLGGRAVTRREQGFSLNLGAHALYRRGPAQTVLAELGVRYTGKSPSTAGLALYDGQLHRLPIGPASLAMTRLFSLTEKIGFGGLFARLPRIRAAQLDTVPWQQWVEDQSRSSKVRQFLNALGRLSCYENDPATTSAGATLAQLQRAVRDGVMYLDGGWQTLVDGLRQAAQSAGATILTEAPVERLDGDGNETLAAVADGSAWSARDVVLALDGPTARRLCQTAHSASPSYAVRPIWVACLDLALKKLPRPERTFVLGVDRPLYLSVHSATAALAPSGMALVQIMKYLGPNADADAGALAAELEGFADALQPGWRDQLVVRQFLPKMQAASAEVRADTRGLAGRPNVVVPGGAGWYCVGDWVGDEGLLVDGVLASARRAATYIMSRPTGAEWLKQPAVT